MLGGYDQADNKGRYFIQGMAPGTYLLQLNLGSRGSAMAQVTVMGSEMAIHDLQIVPTGRVVFRVTDEEGNPLQGVYFYIRDAQTNNWLGWGPASNANGVSTSQALRMGAAMIQAHDSKRKFVVDNFPVSIPSGRTVTVEVVMRKKEPAKK